jgi:glycosyltransferase involved in cell wall biosynthesis
LKISVVITSYNQKKYLQEAIESVLNQTHQPDEVIVVDDCSSDGSQDMILEYANYYPDLVRSFCHDVRIGIPRNRNFALEHANGDLVCFLDGDDRYLPDKLERELETLQQQPEAMLVFSNIYFIDEMGQRLCLWAENIIPPSGYVFKEVFSRHWPRNCLYRNELMNINALRQIGFFDENLHIYEDWDLKIRFTNKFKVAYCPIPLTEYRQHPEGISAISSVELHLYTMKRIYNKNSHLLENLSDKDHREIKRDLSDIFLQIEGTVAVRRGQRCNAIKAYGKLALKNPSTPSRWMPLLRLLPANSFFRVANMIVTKVCNRKSK